MPRLFSSQNILSLVDRFSCKCLEAYSTIKLTNRHSVISSDTDTFRRRNKNFSTLFASKLNTLGAIERPHYLTEVNRKIKRTPWQKKQTILKPLRFTGSLMSYNSNRFANTQKCERFGCPIHGHSCNPYTVVQNMNVLLSQAGTFLSRNSIFSRFV